MKRKLLVLVTALCLILALGTTGVLAADPDPVLYVNGQDIVNAASHTVTCGEGTAVYSKDAATGKHTLTLTNATIDTAGKPQSGYDGNPAGILAVSGMDNLTIVLEGENVIDMSSNPTPLGISNRASALTIKGTAETPLTIKGVQTGVYSLKSLTIDGAYLDITSTTDAGCGLYMGLNSASSETLTIKDAKIVAKIKNSAISVSHLQKVSILNSTLEVETENTAIGIGGTDLFEIDNSNLTIKATAMYSNAIFTSNKLHIKNNSTIKAESGWSTLYSGDSNVSNSGDITIEQSSVDLTSNYDAGIWGLNTLQITNCPKIKVKSAKLGLGADKNVTINGSTIEANSDDSNGVYAGGELVIKDCPQVTANGYYPGLYGEAGMAIAGSTVNANSTDDSAIFSKGDITIGNSTVAAAGINSESENYFPTIYTAGKLTITDNSKISANGYWNGLESKGVLSIEKSKIDVTSTGDAGIYAYKNLVIKDCPEVIVNSYNEAITGDADISIENSTVKAISSDGFAIYSDKDLTITDCPKVTVNGDWVGIDGNETLCVDNSTIEALSGTREAIRGGQITITNCPLITAKGQTVALSATYAMIIQDSKINAIGKESNALYSGDNLNIVDSSVTAASESWEAIQSRGIVTLASSAVKATAPQGKAAIFTREVGDTDTPRIVLVYNMRTVEDAKIATVYDTVPTDGSTVTSFIPTGDKALAADRSNALNEVTIGIPYNLTVEGGKGSGSYVQGGEVAIKGEAPTGKEFKEWSIKSKDPNFTTEGLDLTKPELTLTMPAGNTTATAVFSGITYAPEIQAARNCTVAVSPQAPEYGETVTITLTPAENTIFAMLKVTDGAGKALKVTPGENNTFTFTQPAEKVTIEAAFDKDPAALFRDIKIHDWYYNAVTYVLNSGLMVGTTENTFSPLDSVTRAQIWMVLAREAGAEVEGGAPWYALARTWAMENKVSDGTDPDKAITREQLVTMIWRYAGSPAAQGSLADFVDADEISDWAKDAMVWGVENDIIKGKGGGILDPQGNTLRGELATVLQRYLTK